MKIYKSLNLDREKIHKSLNLDREKNYKSLNLDREKIHQSLSLEREATNGAKPPPLDHSSISEYNRDLFTL